jgi:hypothetical protein
MSVENSKIIDAISLNFEDKVVLTISDHLEWDENNDHVIILQNKINAYLEIIENGELFKNYPDAIDKKIQISIAFKFKPIKIGIEFLKKVKVVLMELDYDFHFYYLGNI